MAKPEDAPAVPVPVVANSHNAVLHSLLTQLDQSQWWPRERMLAGQLQQLRKLVAYAIVYSPYYRERLRGVRVDTLDLDSLRDLPILSRSELQENNDRIDCASVPQTHGEIGSTMTSGSTASPVQLRTTGFTSMMWNALNMREQLWWQRDTSRRMAAIRWRADTLGMAPQGLEFDDWGIPVNQFYRTGPGYYLNSSSDVGDQLRWLQRVRPFYLMTHPSNLKALLEASAHGGEALDFIGQLRTVGESVSEELRALVRRRYAAPLVDFYSSQELGYIALQCPRHEHYHVQGESVLVEVLREDGSPCDPGETGRLLISSLRNYATPLIRYEVGDYAELGAPCDCGRGLPVLTRIAGRVRNMLCLPNGEKRWPNFGFRRLMEVLPLQQFQVVQHSLDRIELRLVVGREVSREEEARVSAILAEHLGHPFAIEISYHAALARGPGGKFEDFVSLV